MLAQKQAEMLVTREREIRNGIREAPTIANKSAWRPFDDVCAEYFAWGKARGGRRNMPWDDEYVAKKRRNLAFWRTCLGLERLGDLYGILPKVEAECHETAHMTLNVYGRAKAERCRAVVESVGSLVLPDDRQED